MFLLTYNQIIIAFIASHITKENNCILDTVKIFHSYPVGGASDEEVDRESETITAGSVLLYEEVKCVEREKHSEYHDFTIIFDSQNLS